MKITQVEYRRLRSFGQYENETVGIVAEVGAGESETDVLASCREWVAEQLGDRESARSLAFETHRQEVRLREVNGLLAESEKRWKAAQKILAAAGVEVPKDWGADDDDLERLPF